MKIWLDDERPAPDDSFIVCKDIFEFNRLIDSLEATDREIDHIAFDYYIDPKNNRFTGLDAVNEVTFFDRCVWPVLSDDFTFSTHSSEKSCNDKMDRAMREYLKNRNN
jgi:hypothetical protein